MNVNTRLRRVLARVAATALVAPVVVLAAAPAHATTLLSDGFESGLGGWTVTGTGASADCAVAATGSCSLKLQPVCCATSVSLQRPVSTDLTNAAANFSFRSESTGGNTDTNFTVVLNSGTVRIHPTSGINNGILLEAPGYGSTEFAHWTTAGQFMAATLTFDPAAHTATATMDGHTATVSISPTATSITGIAIDAVAWGSGPVFHYDDVSVDGGPAECVDGIDNDGDGQTDYPNDLGCAGPGDNSEGATCPPVQGVVVCLDAGEAVTSATLRQVDPVTGTAYHAVGYVDLYRFFTAAGTFTLPCAVLAVNSTTANPCAAAGGTFVSRQSTLVDNYAPTTNEGATIATVAICKAELTATVNGIGVNSAAAFKVC